MNNFHVAHINDCKLYFSYETLVGLTDNDGDTFVSENMWGKTTGKHLNYISSDKINRMPHAQVLQIAEEMFI